MAGRRQESAGKITPPSTSEERSFEARFPFLFDTTLSDDLKKHLVSTLEAEHSARRTHSAETMKWRSSTPLAIALTGLITLAGNFTFDFLRGETESARAVTMTQLEAALKESSEIAARESEVRITQLKADLDQRAADLDSQRQISSSEKEFQFKIVERTLTEGASEVERARVLLFLVRSGILSSLNEDELRTMATETLVAAQGTLDRDPNKAIVVGVPSVTSMAFMQPEIDLRELPPTATALIKSFEGFQGYPVNDPTGFCLIGYGHLVDTRGCDDGAGALWPTGITEEEATRLLEQDTAAARRAVQNLVASELSDQQFGAITSFVFNVGEANFRNSAVLKSLNVGDFDSVPSQLSHWVSAGGVVLQGLAARRDCEGALFQGKELLDQSGQFDRSLCKALDSTDAILPE